MDAAATVAAASGDGPGVGVAVGDGRLGPSPPSVVRVTKLDHISNNQTNV
jgi:hypothetical protein